MEKIIEEFTCIPFICSFDTDKYKIYAVDVNENNFPNIKKNKYGNYTILGNIHNLGLGIEYHVKAEEQKSKNGYGYQYKIIHIQRDRPTNENTTRMFLSELLTPDQVKTIMESYPNIIDIVINNRLDEIDLKKLYNIGQFRFNIIRQKIEENFVFAELIEMFQGLLDMKTVRKLYDKYPSTLKIKQEIQNEPYHCLCSLSQISFKTADSIILELDKESKAQKKKGETPLVYFDFDIKTSVQRAVSAIEYLLEQNENDGHTRIPIVELRSSFDKLVSECSDKFIEAIKNTEEFYIDKESKSISILETYNTELYIAEKLIEGLKTENKWNEIDIEQFRKIGDNELTDEQFDVVKMFYNNNISILNGNAGSGKSFTTQSILSLVKSLNKSFGLFCPTGRASKILSGYTHEDASTIHRGLMFNPSVNPRWGYNEHNKLPYDVVIVDEFGMCDVFLMKHLLEAIDFTKTKLLIIGDSSQIPSVSAGNVFHDLINSNKISIVSLTQIFRYGKGGILTVATKTRNGEKFLNNSKSIQVFGEDKGYIFIPTKQENIINNVTTLYKKLLNHNISKEDIMILSTYNIGEYGTTALNKHLQPISNINISNGGKYIQFGDMKFYEDDMVIQTVNNYKAIKYNSEYYNENDIGFVANGEVGKIIKIEYNNIIIQFDETFIYNKNQLSQVKHSYAISTHRSQGGQAKIVIMITPKAHTFMLNSNIMYVAETRAKERVFHFGEIETVNRAIKKKIDFNRKTHLKELIKENI